MIQQLDPKSELNLERNEEEEVAKLSDLLELIQYPEGNKTDVAQRIFEGSKIDCHLLLYFIL